MDKFKFASITQKETETKYSVWERKTDKFVMWGHRNNFPNELISLYNNSSIHATCINAVVEAIIGEGLTSDNDVLIEQANLEGESWNDIFTKVAKDYKVFGGFALEVIWSKDRTKIAEVYHIDFSWLRAKEKNHRGKIPGYYISDEWGERSYYGEKDLKDIPYLPTFNPKTNKQESNQIYVHQPYQPGMKYYPLPDYHGALKVVDLDTEIDNFHLANIKNGMAPSIAITTFTNSNEEERQQIERMLQEQYAGSENAGRLLYMDVASKEDAPVIQAISPNNADGYYEVLNGSTTQKILTAHRITSPMLLGIKTEGQLGGRTEMLDAYLLFLNTVIKPYQQSILDCFTYLLDYNYPDIELGIIQTKLFDDGTEDTEVVSGLDSETDEEANLQQDIEQSDVINNINNNE